MKPEQEPPLLNTPNVLAFIRLVGSPGLLVFAWMDRPVWFLGWYLFLTMTDWFDGKIAIAWKLQTRFGARLDSVADHTMYACLMAGCLILRSAELWSEKYWIGAAVLSYLASMAAGWFKFGRFPSYHNQAAKIAWLLMIVAVAALFLRGSPWWIRGAAAMVTLSNLESIGITLRLKSWRTDVRSIFFPPKEDEPKESEPSR